MMLVAIILVCSAKECSSLLGKKEQALPLPEAGKPAEAEAD